MPNENPAAAAPPAATPAAKPAAAAPAAATSAPATIAVRVVQQPVSEGGVTYLKNQVLQVTPERAAALGSAFVTPVVTKPAAAPATPAKTTEAAK